MGMKPRGQQESWFWGVIVASRDSWDPNAPDHYQTGNQAIQARRLRELLTELSADDVLRFAKEFYRHFWQAYRCDLWDVAYLAYGGCSDDSFMDFRYWLISMGGDIYDAALAEPASLIRAMTLPGVEYPGFESFGYVTSKVYEAKTGNELPAFREYHREKPLGVACRDEALQAKYPELWARYCATESREATLHTAAEDGDIVMAQKFLSDDVDPNTADEDGMFPLYRAALGGHTEMVNLLLASGAHVKTSNAYGQTALHVAVAGGHLAVMGVLLESGAAVNEPQRVGRTPLFLAVENLSSPTQAIALLAKHEADPNISDKNGCTPLIWAAAEGNREVVRELLRLGANPDTVDSEGYTALRCATENDYPEVAALLRAHHA